MRLSSLLPPEVDFGSCRAEEGKVWHPSMLRAMSVKHDEKVRLKEDEDVLKEFEKQVKFLKDPAFQSAARTFQVRVILRTLSSFSDR